MSNEHELELCKGMMDNLPIAAFVVDKNEKIIYLNPAAEYLTGKSKDVVTGRELSRVADGDLAGKVAFAARSMDVNGKVKIRKRGVEVRSSR